MSTLTEKAQQVQKQRAEHAAIRQIADRLVAQFPEVRRERIEHAIQGRYGEFDRSRIRDFIPVLFERSVKTELSVS